MAVDICLTDTIIHKLTELSEKTSAIRYFYRYLKSLRDPVQLTDDSWTLQTMTAKLKIRNGQLELTENNLTSWSMELESIRLIGEYTTEGGPFVDDYFFVFVDSNGTLYEVSNDLTNDPTFWTELSSLLNGHLQPELANSTLFNSRILYPQHLTGEPLFNIVASGTGELELSEQANGQLKNGDEPTY